MNKFQIDYLTNLVKTSITEKRNKIMASIAKQLDKAVLAFMKRSNMKNLLTAMRSNYEIQSQIDILKDTLEQNNKYVKAEVVRIFGNGADSIVRFDHYYHARDNKYRTSTLEENLAAIDKLSLKAVEADVLKETGKESEILELNAQLKDIEARIMLAVNLKGMRAVKEDVEAITGVKLDF